MKHMERNDQLHEMKMTFVAKGKNVNKRTACAVRRLNRSEMGLCTYADWVTKHFVSKWQDLVFNAFSYFEPSDRVTGVMTGFSSIDNSACKTVLNLLEAGYLRFRETAVKIVAVAKFGVNEQKEVAILLLWNRKEFSAQYGSLDTISFASGSNL